MHWEGKKKHTHKSGRKKKGGGNDRGRERERERETEVLGGGGVHCVEKERVWNGERGGGCQSAGLVLALYYAKTSLYWYIYVTARCQNVLLTIYT